MKSPDQSVERIFSCPVLLLGAGGMLGRAWVNLLNLTGDEWYGPTRAELDLLNEEQISTLCASNWGVVINCAAWTDVEAAESREEDAHAINALSVGKLAEQVKKRNAIFIHYSTDYVFDGNSTRRYRVEDKSRPVNAYGRTKRSGEELIEQVGCERLVVRTSWLYSPWGKNFVKTILEKAMKETDLSVVHDQVGTPTSAQHLAQVTARLANSGARGLWHITDGGSCSWYEFAKYIVRVTGMNCCVTPCFSPSVQGIAKRPSYSVLDTSRTESLVGPFLGWERMVVDVLQQLGSTHGSE